MENERARSACNYRAELEKNSAIAFVPSGNSMWPIIKNRAQSVIVERKNARLEKYDVALYERKNGDFVLHRVMAVKDGGYTVCGDSQYTLEWVSEERVFGVMLGFYKKNKYIEVSNPKYIKKVKSWHEKKMLRKIRLKLFYCFIALKNKLKR